jgi:hypothetical protein
MFTAGDMGLTPTGGITTNPMCAHCVDQVGDMAARSGLSLRLSGNGKVYTFWEE